MSTSWDGDASWCGEIIDQVILKDVIRDIGEKGERTRRIRSSVHS